MFVIIGADGFLGSYLVKTALEQTEDTVLAVSRHPDFDKDGNARIERFACDITNREAVRKLAQRVQEERTPVKIAHLAAYHKPDLVEKNPRLAWEVNIASLAFLLNELEKVKCFFYPSTEMVYGEGEEERLFLETDLLRPVNLYGKQKVLAENMVVTYGYHVVRLPFLIGPSIQLGKKHFYDQIIEDLANGKEVKMFCDALKSALDYGTTARVLISLMEEFSVYTPHIMNLCGDDSISKYDIGVRIAMEHGYDKNLIIPISMEEQKSEFFSAKRAKSACMNNDLLKNTLNMKTLKICLK